MSEIQAKISAVTKYKSTLSTTYSEIKNLAYFQKNEISEWKKKVDQYLRNIEDKISRIGSLLGQADSLVSDFQRMVTQYGAEAAAIYAAGHWEETSDEDGHVTGQIYVYDVAAYNLAMANARKYEVKLSQAIAIVNDINDVFQYLIPIQKNISTALSELSTNENKYSSNIESMSVLCQKNKSIIARIIEGLDDYAKSREFSHPSGSFTSSFFSGYCNSGNSFSREGNASSYPDGSLRLKWDTDKLKWDTDKLKWDTAERSLGGGNDSSEEILSISQKRNLTNQSTTFETFDKSSFKHVEKGARSIKKYDERSNEDVKIIDKDSIGIIVEYTKDGVESEYSSSDINKSMSSVNEDERGVNNKSHRDACLKRSQKISNEIAKVRLMNALRLFSGQPILPIMDKINCNNFEKLPFDDLKQKSIGSQFQMDGFISTSIKREVAEEHANKRNAAIIEILAPKGAQALHLGELSVRGSSIAKEAHEYEILLQERTKYEIMDIERIGPRGEQFYMKVKIVAQERINPIQNNEVGE